MAPRPSFLEYDVAAAPQAPRALPSAKSRLKGVTGDRFKSQGGPDAATAGIAAGCALLAAIVAAVVVRWRRRRAAAVEGARIAAREAAVAAAEAAAAAAIALRAGGGVSFVLAEQSLDEKVAQWAEEEAGVDAAPALSRILAGSAALLAFRASSLVLRVPVTVSAVDREGATLASEIELDAASFATEALLVVFDADGGAAAHPVAHVASARTARGQVRIAAAGVGVAFPPGLRRPVRLAALAAAADGAELQVSVVELGMNGLLVEGPSALPDGAAYDVYFLLDEGADPEQVSCTARSAAPGLNGVPRSELTFGPLGSETRAKIVEHLYWTGVAAS